MKIELLKIVLAGALICLMGFVSCKNDDGNPPEPPIENTTESISLVETAWQCVGFFDIEKNEFTELASRSLFPSEPPPDYISPSYLLFFKTDTSFAGTSFRNDLLNGRFKNNYSTNYITIINFGMTFLTEPQQLKMN